MAPGYGAALGPAGEPLSSKRRVITIREAILSSWTAALLMRVFWNQACFGVPRVPGVA